MARVKTIPPLIALTHGRVEGLDGLDGALEESLQLVDGGGLVPGGGVGSRVPPGFGELLPYGLPQLRAV